MNQRRMLAVGYIRPGSSINIKVDCEFGDLDGPFRDRAAEIGENISEDRTNGIMFLPGGRGRLSTNVQALWKTGFRR